MADGTLLHHIDGHDRPPARRETLDLEERSTRTTSATAPLSGPRDIDHACRAAERAFGDWRRTTPAERQRALLRLADTLEQHAGALTDTEVRDTGKPRAAFRDDE